MATAMVNSVFVFQLLFVDADGTPLDVNNPTITIFAFSDSGVKQELVSTTPMEPADPTETGRYVYAYTIPSAFTEGDTIYGEMAGEHPVSSVVMRYSESVSVGVQPPGTGGMHTRFIRY